MKYVTLALLLFSLVSIPLITFLLSRPNSTQDIRPRASENSVPGSIIPPNFVTSTMFQIPSNHPYLLVNPQEIQEIRNKITTQPWAQNYFTTIKTRVDQPDKFNLAVPGEGYGSTHYYLCPNTGIPLDYYHVQTRGPDGSQPGVHYCPDNDPGPAVTSALISGDKHPSAASNITLDQIWTDIRHGELISRIYSTALVSQIDPNLISAERASYAVKVKTLLLLYADKYTGLKYHDELNNWKLENDPNFTNLPWTGMGKIHGAQLFEAIEAIKLAQAYDLVWNEGSFTPEERARLEVFFRSLADTIEKKVQTTSHQNVSNNVTAWENSAIGTIGFLLNDDSFVLEALNGRSDKPRPGFASQIANTMTTNGFWPESIEYHAYVLSAFVNLTEAARHANLDLYNYDASLGKKFRMMFFYYKNIVLPNGGLPALDDSRIQTKIPFNMADLAYSRFQDDYFAQVMQTNSYLRNNDLSLLYGKDVLPTNIAPGSISSYHGADLGILRNASSYALLNFGEPYIGHQHFSKLNLVYFSSGTLLLPDLGITSYGDTTYYEWYRKTLSHNTIIVDGGSQSGATTAQASEFPKNDQWNIKRMKVVSENAYQDLKLERLIILTPDYLVDHFRIVPKKNPSNHTFDLPYHINLGNIWTTQGLTGLLNISESTLSFQDNASTGFSQNGYQFLTSVKKTTNIGNNFFIEWTSPGLSKRVRLTGVVLPADDSVFQAWGPFPPAGNTKLFIIWRKSGQAANFVSVIESYEESQRKIEEIKLEGSKLQIRRRGNNGSMSTDSINLYLQ